jgi:rRNA-processing protein FCF1
VDDQLLLRPGRTVDDVLSVLRTLKVEVDNIKNGGGTPNEGQMRYVQWVEHAEVQLRSVFVADAVWRSLFSDRYWHLRSMTMSEKRPWPVVSAEAEVSSARLQSMMDVLAEDQRLFALSNQEVVLMPDTNVLMHYTNFDQVKWNDLIGSPVRLVFTLVVVDELDDLSYRSKVTSDRARGVIKVMEKLKIGPKGAVEIRPNVMGQILMDSSTHARRSNDDDEFLMRAQYLNAFVDGELYVCSADRGVRLRASLRDLKIFKLPDALRLPAPAPAPSPPAS